MSSAGGSAGAVRGWAAVGVVDGHRVCGAGVCAGAACQGSWVEGGAGDGVWPA